MFYFTIGLTIAVCIMSIFLSFRLLAFKEYAGSGVCMVLAFFLAFMAQYAIHENNNPVAVEHTSSIYHKDIISLNMDQFILVESNTEQIIYMSKDGKYMFVNSLSEIINNDD